MEKLTPKTVRATKKDWKAIERNAKGMGLSMSAYLVLVGTTGYGKIS